MFRKLNRVSIAQHVILEHQTTHSRQWDTAGTNVIVGSIHEAFLSIGDQLFSPDFMGVIKPSIPPVTMRSTMCAFLSAQASFESTFRNG